MILISLQEEYPKLIYTSNETLCIYNLIYTIFGLLNNGF